MTTAREIMSEDTTYCSTDTTAADAARRMASEDIGAVPVCDADGHLCGVVTDRDLAVKVVAEGVTRHRFASGNSSTSPRSSPSAPMTAPRRRSAP